MSDKPLTEREQLDLQRKMIREEFAEEREDKDGQHNSN